jgi:chromosome segregation ATPase
VDREKQFLENISNLNAKYLDITEKYQKCIAQKENIQENLTSLKEQLVEKQSIIDELNLAIQERVQEYSQLLQASNNKNNASESDYLRLLEEKQEIETVLEMTQKEKEVHAEQLTQTESKVTELALSLQNLKSEHDNLQQTVDTYNQLEIDYWALKHKYAEAESEIERLKQDHIKQQTTDSDVQLVIRDLEEQLSNSNKQLELTAAKLDDLEKSGEERLKVLAEEKDQEIDRLRDINSQERDELNNQVSALQVALKNAEDNMSGLAQTSEAHAEDKNKIEAFNVQLRSENENLRSMVSNYQSDIVQLKSELNTEYEKQVSTDSDIERLRNEQTSREKIIHELQDKHSMSNSEVVRLTQENLSRIGLIHSLEEEKKKSEGEIEKIRHELTELQKRYDSVVHLSEEIENNLNAEIADLKDQVEQDQNEIKELSEEITKAENDKALKENIIVQLEEGNESVQQQIDELTQDYNRTLEKLSTMQQTVNTVTSERNTAVQLLEKLEVDLATAKKEAELFDGRVKHLEQNLEQILQKAQQEQEALQQTIDEKQKLVLQLEDQLHNSYSEIGDNNQLSQQLQVELNRVINERDSLQEQLTNSTKELQQLANDLNSRQNELSEVIFQKDKINQSKDKLEEDLAVLQQSNSKLKQELSEAKVDLIEKDQHDNKQLEIALKEKAELCVQFEQSQSNISNMTEVFEAMEASRDDLLEQNQIYANQQISLKTQVAIFETQVKQMESALSNAEFRGAELEITCRDLKAKIDQDHNISAQSGELELTQQKLLDVTAERNNLIENLKELEILNSTIEQLNHKNVQLASALESRENELNTMKNEKSDTEQRAQNEISDLTALVNDLREAHSVLTEETEKLRETNTSLETSSEDLIQLGKEKGTIAAELDDANKQIKLREQQLKYKQVKLEEYKQLFDKQEKEISLLEERFENIQEELADTKKELKKKSQQLIILEKEHHEEMARVNAEKQQRSESLIKELEATIQELSSKNADLAEEKKSLEGQLATVKEPRITIIETRSDEIDGETQSVNNNEVELLREELENTKRSYEELRVKYEHKLLQAAADLSKPQSTLLAQDKLLTNLQTMIFHLEKTRHERQYYKNLYLLRDQEFTVLKKKNVHKDNLITLLYSHMNSSNNAKQNQADQMKSEIDQLMEIISRTKKNLNTPRGVKPTSNNLMNGNQNVSDH